MSERIVVVGGGAAGFFAAITCAQAAPGARITLIEKTAQFLSKVRISGGGRCNVTHACFDPLKLSSHYPRGGPALVGSFQTFQPRHSFTSSLNTRPNLRSNSTSVCASERSSA